MESAARRHARERLGRLLGLVDNATSRYARGLAVERIMVAGQLVHTDTTDIVNTAALTGSTVQRSVGVVEVYTRAATAAAATAHQPSAARSAPCSPSAGRWPGPDHLPATGQADGGLHGSGKQTR